MKQKRGKDTHDYVYFGFIFENFIIIENIHYYTGLFSLDVCIGGGKTSLCSCHVVFQDETSP